MPDRDTFLEDGAVLRDLLILGYAGAVGFVSAGIVASLYQWVTAQSPRFGLLGTSLAGWFTSFAFCAVTGPVIIAGHAFRVRKDRRGFGTIALGMTIVSLWSCCLGIVVLQLALSLAYSFA